MFKQVGFCLSLALIGAALAPVPAGAAPVPPKELALDFRISNDASKFYGGPDYPDTFIRDIGVTRDYFLLGLGTGSEVAAVSKDRHKVRIMANDVAYTLFFGHGAASDNKSVWTSDYFGGNVFEFDIGSGRLVKTWQVPLAVTRMDYDPWTKSLVLTAYNDPTIYIYSLEGELRGSIPVTLCGSNIGVSVLKKGYLVMGAPGAGDSDRTLYFYDRSGNLKQHKVVDWGYWDIDHFQGYVYYDTPEGTIERVPLDQVFSDTDPESGEPSAGDN